MQQLVAMRMTHNCTMLILAHTPKRKQGDPLTIDDLAGSKLLSNFADNIIGFNKSRKDKDMRYFIQLKYRSLPIELDFKNVQELTLTSSDGWLHLNMVAMMRNGHICQDQEMKGRNWSAILFVNSSSLTVLLIGKLLTNWVPV